jgi:hypothetical protein
LRLNNLELCNSVDLATTPTPKLQIRRWQLLMGFWVGLIVSALVGPRFRDPISAHPTERPPVSVKATGFILLGLLPLQSSLFLDPPADLSVASIPYLGVFIPRVVPFRPISEGTWDCPVQGFIPSTQRLPARRWVLPPCRCSAATCPVSQVAMAPVLDFEVLFRAEMQCSVCGVTRIGSALPSSGFILLWDPVLLLSSSGRSQKHLPLRTLGFVPLTSPK